MNLPASLRDLCVVAGKKLSKEYGLEDLFVKTAAHNEVTSKALGSDNGDKVPIAEDKGDNEDVVDDTAYILLLFMIKG